MSTLSIRHDVRLFLGNEEIVLTHPSNVPTITGITQKDDAVVTIAPSTTVVLWDPTVLASLANFDYFYALASGADVDLEFTCNEGAATELIDMKVARVGVPFQLGSNVSTFGAIGGFVGTLDVIDRIRARNRSTTVTATLRRLLAT